MAANEMQFKEPLESNGSFNGLEDEEFKERLVREVVKVLQQKKPLDLLWPQLDKQTSYNSQELWKEMSNSVLKKVKCLLAKNDIIKDVDTVMRFTPTDWLLFDLVLVNEKINVIDCEIMPSCFSELYGLMKEYNVETLVGDQLAEAWIDITLNYNNRGRQCSPMLLQLRWYQLKKLAREQVFRPDESLHPNKTKLFHSMAITFQKIITKPFPKWKTLLDQKRLILPKHFVKIIKKKWKDIEASDTWYMKCDTVNLNKERTVSEDTSRNPYPLSSLNNDLIAFDSDDDIENFLREKAELFHARLKECQGIGKREGLKRIKPIDTESEYGHGNKRKHNESLTDTPKIGTGENKIAIDPKLAMNTIVYTKKLDAMKVFKYFDYSFVNDKNVIENVILESKPVYKRVCKGHDVISLKEKYFKKSNINDNQAQNPHVVALSCTSWLLKKPKDRRYNPIKLRRNPDFNVHLKTLTPKFLNLTSNRKLLKQCKPLTIDVHREFEHKLVNGTIRVTGFASHKRNTAKIGIRDRPLAVEALDTNNSTETVHTDKNITIPSSNMKQTIIETDAVNRKIINLPDINKLRIFNQSLQTAEVPPMRSDNTNMTTLKRLLSIKPKHSMDIEKISSVDVASESNVSDALNDRNKLYTEPNNKSISKDVDYDVDIIKEEPLCKVQYIVN